LDEPANQRNIVKQRIIFYSLILSVAAVVSYVHFFEVLKPDPTAGIAVHNAIIEGEIQSPYRYRILTPYAMEPSINLLENLTSEKNAFLASYGAHGFLMISLFLIILARYLKNWFCDNQVLIGVLFVASVLALPLTNPVFQPWGLTETVFFTLSLLLMLWKRYVPLGIVLVFAALNKETSIVIPITFLLVNLDIASFHSKESLKKVQTWRPFILFAIYMAIWAAVYFLLRALLGDAEHVHTLEWLWHVNTQRNTLIHAAVNVSLFMGAFWIFAILGVKKSPQFIRRAALVTLVYIPAVMLYGVWYEVRLLMPLYPLIIPLGMFYLFSRGMEDIPT